MSIFCSPEGSSAAWLWLPTSTLTRVDALFSDLAMDTDARLPEDANMASAATTRDTRRSLEDRSLESDMSLTPPAKRKASPLEESSATKKQRTAQEDGDADECVIICTEGNEEAPSMEHSTANTSKAGGVSIGKRVTSNDGGEKEIIAVQSDTDQDGKTPRQATQSKAESSDELGDFSSWPEKFEDLRRRANEKISTLKVKHGESASQSEEKRKYLEEQIKTSEDARDEWQTLALAAEEKATRLDLAAKDCEKRIWTKVKAWKQEEIDQLVECIEKQKKKDLAQLEARYKKKFDAQNAKHEKEQKEHRARKVKLDEAERALREAKHDFKATERQLKEEQKTVIREAKPETSSKIKKLEADLKTKISDNDTLHDEVASLTEREQSSSEKASHYEEKYSSAAVNVSLAKRKISDLEYQLAQWKSKAHKEIEQVKHTQNEKWKLQCSHAEQNANRVVEAQRYARLLNEKNERSNRKTEELQAQLRASQHEVQSLRTRVGPVAQRSEAQPESPIPASKTSNDIPPRQNNGHNQDGDVQGCDFLTHNQIDTFTWPEQESTDLSQSQKPTG